MIRSLLSIVGVASVLTLAATSACKSADKVEDQGAQAPPRSQEPGSAKKPGSTEPGSDQPGAKKPAKPAPEPIPESAVKAAMDKWLAAQNEGNFATYEGFYAKRLEGVRRSGEKVVRLDRKGWVKERKRMFKRKMVVEVSDLDIDIFTQTAIVTFTQRWASGRYEDIGPKQIVMIREGGALRIAREEMLQSTLIGDSKKTALADKRFVFVIKAGKREYAVFDKLGDIPTGALSLISKGDPVIVSAEVDEKELPAAVEAWRGASLQHAACRATVGEILALSRIVPHFGERQTWDGTFDDTTEPMSDGAIAEAAFHNDAAYLVGALRTDGCSMGAYASVANQPAPAVGEPVTSDIGAIETAARKAFRNLKSYKQIAEEFSEFNHGGDWESYGADGSKPGEIRVTVMRHSGNQKLFAVAQAHSGMGCGDFEGSLTVFFAVSGSRKSPKLKKVHETRTHPRIVAALDIADNGTLGFLVEDFTDTLLTAGSGKIVRRISVAFFDCGC